MATSASDEFKGVVGRTVRESQPWWPEPARPPEGAPNVVVVVFDDVGFSDFGCYGSEIRTPNLDALAAEGLRFTNFHTTALCSPTRAALLTGRNHHSVGMATLANWDMGYPGARGHIAHSAGTLAEMLRPHGYSTFAIGKWHLTPMEEASQAGPFDQWPLARGFDRFYGFLEGETNQWKPELTYDNHHIDPPDTPGYHLTEDLVDRSLEFVRNQRSFAPERPFFLYLALGACHAPHHVARDYIDRYVPVFEKGWDRTREDRLARQVELGVVPPGTQLPPRNPGVRAWDTLTGEERTLYTRLQAAFAGMLEHADENLGRLFEALRGLDSWDNTLVVVISDNGASQEGSPFGTVNASRFFNAIRDELDYNIERLDQIGEAHLNNNYPLGWAMAGNTPLKRYKQNTHGGGVRDPLIVRGPGIASTGGEVRGQFCHAIDITPTILDLVGVAPPATINGVSQAPIEGASLRGAMVNPDTPPARDTQYFEMFGHRGIWHRGWKAVAWHDRRHDVEEDQWELYHLDEDFSEANDLASEHPEKLRELVERWWVEAGKHKVLPIDPRTGDRWAESGSPHERARARYVLYPGTAHLPSHRAPDTRNRSWRIAAEVVAPAEGVDGVILAHGDACAGYSFFVQDGHLVFDYNFAGTHYIVRSGRALAVAGRATLGFEFTKTGDHQGLGRLFVDGALAGEGVIPHTLRQNISFEGMDVGRDSLVPVGDYEAPFEFTAGALVRVLVTLEPDQAADHEARFAAEVARQ